MPTESLLDKMEKKLSKSGKSEAEIAAAKNKIKEMDDFLSSL
jgi:hypothetical protein